MTKSDKLKIFLGTLYLIIISVFLWYFFSYFTIEELTSYDFLKNNRDYLIEIKESNILLSSIIFFTKDTKYSFHTNLFFTFLTVDFVKNLLIFPFSFAISFTNFEEII